MEEHDKAAIEQEKKLEAHIAELKAQLEVKDKELSKAGVASSVAASSVPASVTTSAATTGEDHHCIWILVVCSLPSFAFSLVSLRSPRAKNRCLKWPRE